MQFRLVACHYSFGAVLVYHDDMVYGDFLEWEVLIVFTELCITMFTLGNS